MADTPEQQAKPASWDRAWDWQTHPRVEKAWFNLLNSIANIPPFSRLAFDTALAHMVFEAVDVARDTERDDLRSRLRLLEAENAALKQTRVILDGDLGTRP
jgi:hypothetical protein